LADALYDLPLFLQLHKLKMFHSLAKLCDR